MGIKGLTSFVDSLSSVWTQKVKLKDSRVIVDGSALLFYLYPSCDRRCGGQYGDLANAIEHFFGCLRSNGLDVFVILDGPTVAIDIKLETLIGRAERTVVGCHELSKATKDTSLLMIPSLARLLLMQKMASLEIRYAVCDWEADQEIASLAHQWKCHVISNDSDFFIYDLPAGYIPLSELSYNEVSVRSRVYNRKKLTKYLDIPETFLPLFASLIGNDFVGRDVLEPFNRALQRIQPLKRSLSKKVAKMLSLAIFLAKSNTLPEALQSVLNIVNKEDEKKDLETALRESMAEYDICDGTLASHFELGEVHSSLNQEIPRYVIERYRNGSFPESSLGIMTSGRRILKFQVEDTNEVSSNNCSKRLRQVIYGIVTKPEAKVVEWDRSGQAVKRQRVQPLYDISGYGELPNLDSLQELDEDQRRNLMLSTLEANTAAILSLPDSIQLFAASIRYWISHANPRVPIKCIKVLIAQHLQILRDQKQKSAAGPSSRHQKQKRKYLMQPFDIKCQHSLAQWQSVMFETIILNQILMDVFPVPDISTLYNGVEMQTMMHGPSQGNHDSTLDGFSHLYGAVTDGLELGPRTNTSHVDTADGKSRRKERKKTRPKQESLPGNRFAALLSDHDDDDSSSN